MWIFGWKGASGFSGCSTADQVTNGIDATGLTAIVTGASSGIGKETSRVLALRGAHVVMAVRNVDAGTSVKEEILKEIPTAKVDIMMLDLSSMASVKKFASEYVSSGLPLNLLINNAGIMMCPYMLSTDKVEMQFATNHVGHFLLTHLLLDTMKTTARDSNREGRIVILSSEAHRYPYKEGIRFDKINSEAEYSTMRAYGQSKLANALHANELARRFKEEGVNITANSLHPGVIATNLLRHTGVFNAITNTVGKFVMKNVQQGAATTCYVALHPQVKGVSGEYFSDSNIHKATTLAKDEQLGRKLWDFSLDSDKMWVFGWKGESGFSARSTAEEVTSGIDGTGLTAIVTGATSGLGLEATRVLALRGVHVVMAVRDVDAGYEVRRSIMEGIPNAKLDVMKLDLSSLASVREFASDFISTGLPLNILLNNAGIMACPFSLSEDNIELQFATNHLGHFLLTNLLLETMKTTADSSNRKGRIVIVGSLAHCFTYREVIRFDRINDESGYFDMRAYGQSKLANILYAKELARRLEEDGVNITVNSLHPGSIVTNLLRYHSFIN
ncbi:Short-chain dehydrogenase TIC 32, chloroplastic [Linum perenne]